MAKEPKSPHRSARLRATISRDPQGSAAAAVRSFRTAARPICPNTGGCSPACDGWLVGIAGSLRTPGAILRRGDWLSCLHGCGCAFVRSFVAYLLIVSLLEEFISLLFECFGRHGWLCGGWRRERGKAVCSGHTPGRAQSDQPLRASQPDAHPTPSLSASALLRGWCLPVCALCCAPRCRQRKVANSEPKGTGLAKPIRLTKADGLRKNGCQGTHRKAQRQGGNNKRGTTVCLAD
jgi:hypothetical protein